MFSRLVVCPGLYIGYALEEMDSRRRGVRKRVSRGMTRTGYQEGKIGFEADGTCRVVFYLTTKKGVNMDCKKTCKDYFRKGACVCAGCNKNKTATGKVESTEHTGCGELREQVVTHDRDDDNDEEILSDDFGNEGKNIYNVPVTHTFVFKDEIEVAADSKEEAISRARAVAEDRDESEYGYHDSDNVVIAEDEVERFY